MNRREFLRSSCSIAALAAVPVGLTTLLPGPIEKWEHETFYYDMTMEVTSSRKNSKVPNVLYEMKLFKRELAKEEIYASAHNLPWAPTDFIYAA